MKTIEIPKDCYNCVMRVGNRCIVLTKELTDPQVWGHVPKPCRATEVIVREKGD